MRYKKKYKNCLTLLFFIIVSLNSIQAQTSSITGSIKEYTEANGVIVTLIRASDTAFVKTTFCNEQGKFEFELVKQGSYQISISVLGYKKYLSSTIEILSTNLKVQLPPIVLQPKVNEIDNVTVTAKKSFVEKKIDRVVINPDALIGNAGATALEVLEKAPGVLIDVNGNISLQGKQGVVVFIDDKPTYLSAADLAGYLRSLPAGNIESIEIMVNPPAKYDAAGNAGIINIKLKKNKTIGWNGGINISYGQGRYRRSNNSFNLNYRINKFNFFSNIGFTQNHSYQDLTINRYYYNTDGSYNSGFTQNSYIKKEQQSTNARLGADYYATSKTTLGIVLAGFINPSFSPVDNTAVITNSSNQPVNYIVATNPAEKLWKNGSINLNYSYKPNTKGSELTANADYIVYNSTVSQNLVNKIFSSSNILQSSSTLQSSLPATITIQSVKADYTNPLTQGGKIDMGIKYSWVSTNNTADFYDVVNNVSTPNYQFSNKFKYTEGISAAYINYAKDFKSFSIQAGLRLENTHINGHQLGNPAVKDSTFSLNYNNLFPTLFMAYRLDTVNKHQLGLSVGRRIDRPNYQDMNPFTYPLDRYTYYGGNPFLQPTFSYNIQLSHTYKNIVTTTLDYSITNNLIQETNEQRGNIYYSRPGNFGKQIAYGINVNASLPITKWWTMQLYTELKNLTFKSDVYGQKLDEGRFYWYIGPTNQFVINKKLTAEFAGSYQTRVLVAQFLTIPVWQARVGFAHKIMKGKGSLKLNVSDLFYTNQPGGDIRNIANSKANWLSYLDSRVVSLAFSYRFNKGKALNARQSGASDTEKGRVKTN